MLTVLTRATLC